MLFPLIEESSPESPGARTEEKGVERMVFEAEFRGKKNKYLIWCEVYERI
jgi:hypothetical protein